MKLESGISLAWQQFKALGIKNMRLTRRNKKGLFFQFFIPFIFLFFLFGLQKMLYMADKADPQFREEKEPQVEYLSRPIIPCEEFSVRPPCYDFVWSGDSVNNPNLERVVKGIMDNNPGGRVIPSAKVKWFKTPEETNAWLFDNPARCPGALHLRQENPTIISYGLQINSSIATLENQEEVTYKFELPLQIAVERQIAQTLIGVPNFTWTVGLKEFPHPARPLPNSDTFQLMGSTWFALMTLFVFQNQLSSLVMEKELNLRQAMNIMGLYDSAYWLSWLAWETIMTFMIAMCTTIFGLIFQFSFFTHNNFLILFLLLFLYLLGMTAIAFVMSVLISTTSSAYLVTIGVFLTNMTVQIIALNFADSRKVFNILQKILPAGPFFSSLNMLIDATSNPTDQGISWKRRNQCTPTSSPKCLYTIDGAFLQLIADFFLWFVLALYLDNVVPSVNGIPKSFVYFLNPGYWTGKGGSQASGSGIFSCARWKPKPEEIIPDDQDVLEEENNIRQQEGTSIMDPNVAVQIRGLVKTYVGKLTSPPFHAIKGLWVNFPKDQLFCLLGHNGAGKSTTISCLTGITSVSGGDALIYENSIRNSVGMTNIRRIIGVCPQFDILWNVLTGEEHLELFSNIKGLPPNSILTIIQKLLEDVKLATSAKVRAGSYSGGMRRRLSVAAALLGDPKLVILDEPTTGMDPVTRRHVWDIIESAKRGRAIVLTTHSMEEADVLSDRIGIMAKGRLCCVGTPIRLKMRFGTGFVANLSFTNNADETTNARGREALKHLFKTQLDVMPTEETMLFLTFVIPHDREPLLKKTFGEVQERQSEFGISDIQLGLATLEEVFLNVNREDKT